MRCSLLFLCLAFFFSCKKNEGNPAPDQVYLNVAYGTDSSQKMDVYLPTTRNSTDTKVVVLIHGGAWTSGDKSEFTPYISSLRKRLPDYAIFNINYRLARLNANAFPVQETDVKTAIDSIMARSSVYGFNKAKLALLGASAGAHLALLQAYKNAPAQVKAIADFFGPTDMVALYNASPPGTQLGIQLLMGGSPANNPSLYQQASPGNYVSAQSPPTIILHGTLDDVVPIAQSVNLKNKLSGFGVPVEMYTYSKEGHGWSGSTLEDSFDKIAAFLLSHLP
jgi:acetyl esterase/lipase